ncbi:MAG: 4Fe-4S binding protein [Brevefilum sp.]|nr:4Fe-4S binding protein [Brevefilum sp.]
MPGKDVYEKLCDYFGLQTGPVPDRDNLIAAFKHTLPEDTLNFYFLLPLFGEISESNLEKKAKRKGFIASEIENHMSKLINESFIERHRSADEDRFSRVFGAFVAENQVRKKKGTAVGKRYAKYWMDLAEVSTFNLPTKTPYARVLAVEESIPSHDEGERIIINETIKDTRQAVPYDFVTEMMRNTTTIALAECYCRLSMEMAGKPCTHEKETCFLFNEAGRNLIEIGVAREVSLEEALEIVRHSEEAGLVHNINNAEGEVNFMCNCCSCCCPILGALKKGLTNVSQPSRFLAVVNLEACISCLTCLDYCYTNALSIVDGSLSLDVDLCIGCGLCASHCPEDAISMILRGDPNRIYETAKQLDAKIQREAMIGKITSWIKN